MKTKSIILSLFMLVALVTLTSASNEKVVNEDSLVKYCDGWERYSTFYDELEDRWYDLQTRTCHEDYLVLVGYDYGWVPIYEMHTNTTTETRRVYLE